MPLRDTTHDVFQPPTTQAQPPEDLPSEQLLPANSTPGIFHSTGLDPNASTSWDYDRANDLQDFPPSLTSTFSSNHELFPPLPNSRAISTTVRTPEVTSTVAASSTVPDAGAGSPTTRLPTEVTPLSDRATSVSTMTPPMSPPKIKGIFPSASSTKVS